MKILVLNGIPHTDNNTAVLLRQFIKDCSEPKNLSSELSQYDAYENRMNLSHCTGCRVCESVGLCALQDNMKVVYDGDYDVLVIASPVCHSDLTPPLLDIYSRLQPFCSAGFKLAKRKAGQRQGFLLLTAENALDQPSGAVQSARQMFRAMNISFESRLQVVGSYNTDRTAACNDKNALNDIKQIAYMLPSLF